MSTTPDGKTPEMKQNEKTNSPYPAAMPQELASAVNLMAHPMAGAAAVGALGLGFASQAMGMWLGAVAGAAEASHKLLKTLPEPDVAPSPVRKPAGLKLVVSKPAPQRKAAAPAPKKTAAPKKAEKAGPVEAASPAKPAGIDKPAKPDDLKAISGVGPKLETVLNGLGIWTYGQIAALDADGIAWLDDHLGFSGRIGRDDWIGQATTLDAKQRVLVARGGADGGRT